MSKAAPFQRFRLLKQWMHFTVTLEKGQSPQIYADERRKKTSRELTRKTRIEGRGVLLL
jgi:hypothetical protein